MTLLKNYAIITLNIFRLDGDENGVTRVETVGQKKFMRDFNIVAAEESESWETIGSLFKVNCRTLFFAKGNLDGLEQVVLNYFAF